MGRYVLRSSLGKGGMGEVFLADLQATDDISKAVVLKRILPHMARDPKFVTMFLDEARLASKLSHPNVVQLFDFGKAYGEYFLAMEYLPGESVRQVLEQALVNNLQIPLSIVLHVATSVCSGLHYAHELKEEGVSLNIVHRDVTPANIMLTYQGMVKLLDFGVARAANRRQETTGTGLLRGKLSYCAPEQLAGIVPDRRSDVFALGVVCHEMLTTEPLFNRDSEMATLNAILHYDVPPISDERDDVLPELGRVLSKALAKDRAERFQTAREFEKALAPFISGPVDLSVYMAELFGDERARSSVELSVSKSGEYSTNSINISREVMDSNLSATRVLPTDDGEKTQPRHGMLIALLVVLVALGGGIVWSAILGKHDGTSLDFGSGTSTLRIDTLPRGATLEVGEHRLEGSSPAVVERIAGGQWLIRATLPGYEPATEVVSVEDGSTRGVVITLTPLASLKVLGAEGATLKVNGKTRELDGPLALKAGRYEIEIVRDGFAPVHRTVVLRSGEHKVIAPWQSPRTSRRATRRPTKRPGPVEDPASMGTLDVACVPWCRIQIDGKAIARPSPVIGLKLAAGEHELVLEHPPSGKKRTKTITIKAGKHLRDITQFSEP